MIKITVNDQTPELMQKVEKAISRFVRKGALYIEGELKSSMAEAKSGTQRGTHVASAAGESPAIDSSNFIGSIQIENAVLESKIGTPLEYPVYLEYGTGNMAARPLWQKTRDDAIPVLETLLENELAAI